ncbi:bifunctional phosphopantothenoylcysteine decarboxylase/phosphopantothenate--cysteine ligase CoaBC [Cohnella luojiensis]|uniref:Coenzyme A biosynthesis bifunctional protein CoaBC n=1 Tax=Cohnella luojiensis TaxID=652876 RepID=A0A4Y8M7A2_9BACL|nr:bifunctional phosphopantothenoylcysteine decarboxylase/phosphopantothenate--cysteine ligase CoaBC [Cohnella luojiensis]TFE31840.1 bifunctional phosphopantothenoylcysteine decarboxylase/phosphopantothenate--cysteine ligase CoaBC [Cohnella luojiensis]
MNKPLSGKTVLLGVTGGIAAYKAATLCSRLVSLGANVKVIMTEGATKFITPLTLQVLTRNPVATDIFDERDAAGVQHIDLADSADLAVIAPATANILSKLANGSADDMLSTTMLATTAPLLIAPAMNVHMWEHPAVIDNVNKLASRGATFVEPGTGQLACGYVGKGRLAEPDEIVEAIVAMLAGPKPLSGQRLVVTAGGTVERIDPVRYITNDSSGKMGFAIAEAARDRGAEVTLICGKTEAPVPNGVLVVKVDSAIQMHDEVMKRLPDADIVVKAAAVADYRPLHRAEHKMKKTSESLTLELVRNPDILQAVGEWKSGQPLKDKPFVVGFAAETTDVEKHAMDKLNRKKCDLIVANDITEAGAGFGTETNIVTVYGAEGPVEQLPQMIKRAVAERLMDIVLSRMNRGKEQASRKGTEA